MSYKVSKIDFERLLDFVLTLWPDSLNVIEQHHFSGGGMRAPVLVGAHEKVEEELEMKLSGMDLSIAEAIEFSVFTFFHKKIREEKLLKLEKDSIDRVEVMKIMNSYEAWFVDNA